MEQQLPSENFPLGNHDQSALDGSIQALWDRVRQAAEAIARLRNENRALHEKIHEQDRQLQRAGQEFREAQEQLKTQTRQPIVQVQPSPFDNGEREALVARVKEVLAKLDAYL